MRYKITRYTVQATVEGSTTWHYGWRVARGAFAVHTFTTEDRRLARRAVRMARRLGYDVSYRTNAR